MALDTRVTQLSVTTCVTELDTRVTQMAVNAMVTELDTRVTQMAVSIIGIPGKRFHRMTDEQTTLSKIKKILKLEM